MLRKIAPAIALVMLGGCAHLGVKPWERELLARNAMLPDSDGNVSAYRDHIYFSMEAATGGRNSAGGGLRMQLNQTPSRKGQIAAGLAALTANLLGVAAHAQDAPSAAQNAPQRAAIMDEGAAEPGSVVVDTSVLFYQEQGGRVRAIEPVTNITKTLADGSTVNGSFTYDSLTGATPNGATRWTSAQTFTSISSITTTKTYTTSTGTTKGTTSTGASGTSTATTTTTVSGTTTTTTTSSYNAAANALPLAGFKDHRVAGNLGYTFLPATDWRISVAGDLSFERDYSTFSGTLGVGHDFNQKNTTVAAAVTLEQDQSKPYNGTPVAFENLNSLLTGARQSKTVVNANVSLTQTMTRRWLTQLTYTFSGSQGYHTDPYRIMAVVDATSGAPLSYVYESRPRERQRHTFYWGNKLALGPTVADIGLRYYTDSWGIKAVTAEISEQIPLGRLAYIKPLARYYHQSAANFFRYYLVNGGNWGAYASSDSRLSRFDATTLGLRAGVRIGDSGEFYVDAEKYQQTGLHYLASAPGALARVDMFSGLGATSVITGYRVKF
jgi:hypothetical protein